MANEEIKVEHFDGYNMLVLNRPRSLNSINTQMYLKLAKLLEQSASDEKVKLVVLTGAGKYFTSGADLNEILEGAKSKQKPNILNFQIFVDTLIKFPKPLIAAVNGPAVGVGVTILPFCDLVFATSSSSFLTPFSKIGIIPEACSSYTFPRIMGFAKASKLLLFSEKIDSKEAKEIGLVSEIFADNVFEEEVFKKVEYFAKNLSLQTLMTSKNLIRMNDQQRLLEVNRNECKHITKIMSNLTNKNFGKIKTSRL